MRRVVSGEANETPPNNVQARRKRTDMLLLSGLYVEKDLPPTFSTYLVPGTYCHRVIINNKQVIFRLERGKVYIQYLRMASYFDDNLLLTFLCADKKTRQHQDHVTRHECV